MHGAGSPQAQRIMISRLVDLKGKQRKAKRLCGIATKSVGSTAVTNPMQQLKSIK
jgi:aromatic ring hydroxylase